MIQSATTSNSSIKPYLPFLLILGLSLAVFFGHLGSVPLFNPDESLYAEPAREMLDTGEYITTLLNYAVRFTKPPLVIWCMALSYKLFGMNEFAARSFCALCGTLLTISTYFFIAKLLNKKIAFLTALILITAPLYISVGRTSITDMPLSFFTAGSLMALFLAFKEKNRFLEKLGYIFIGLAVMTKGPVGIVLPGLIMGAFYILSQQRKEALSFFNIWQGILIIAVLSLPWFILEIYLTKGAYFQEFILRENFQRYTSVVDSHKGGWWYHIAAVLGGLFPWSIFLPQAIFRFFKEKQFASKDTSGQIRLFAVCWALITILFFSTSVSKLLPYTLPAFPALAILIALEINDALAAHKSGRLFIPLLIILLIFAGAALSGTYILGHIKEAPLDLRNILQAFALYNCLIAIVSLIFVVSNLGEQAILCFGLALLAGILYFGIQLLPKLSYIFEGNIPAYARLAGATKREIIVFDLRKPGVPFYAHRKVLQPKDKDELDQTLTNLNEAYVITRKRDLKLLDKQHGYKIVDQDPRFVLLLWERSPLAP